MEETTPNSDSSFVKIKKGSRAGSKFVAHTFSPLKHASMHSLGDITNIIIKNNIVIVIKINECFFKIICLST